MQKEIENTNRQEGFSPSRRRINGRDLKRRFFEYNFAIGGVDKRQEKLGLPATLVEVHVAPPFVRIDTRDS